MIVTIDGPAGSGKSTAARGLAARVGFDLLDTGAMYRAVALHCLAHEISLDDHARVGGALPAIRIEMPPGRVLLNGRDVTHDIRSSALADGSSKVAVIHAVREFLIDQQRRLARDRSIVTEGRDQGTVVFPDAKLKVFLVASPESRALRRHRDLQARGEEIAFDEVLRRQIERDRRDSERAEGPLAAAPDALAVDTTDMTIAEVIDLLTAEVAQRCPPG